MFERYSFALDDNADTQHVSIRGVYKKFNTTKEFVRLVPMKGMTTGAIYFSSD